MKPLKNPNTRCNFCSLGCYVSLAESAQEEVRPEYDHDVPPMRKGVCGRGNMTAELLRHPRRCISARIAEHGLIHEAKLDEAVKTAAGAVWSDGGTLLIDGNLPCEDIATAIKLAASSAGKISARVFLPPEDESALEGFAASGAKLFTPENLVECDAFLIVGDAFGTHPVISRPIHDARRKNPRMPLVVVDSARGHTSIFASALVTVRPGGESRVLAAIAAACGVADLGMLAPIPNDAGAPAGDVANAARAVAGAKKLGVILRAEPGKASNWDQAVFLAGKIAEAKGGGVALCLTYGNAMGAYRLAKMAGVPVGASVQAANTLIALGGDPATAMMKEEAATLHALRTLVAANSMPVATMEMAHVALPLAFNFEAGGTTITGSGEIVRVEWVADAPGQAVLPGVLVEELAKSLGIQGIVRDVNREDLEAVPSAEAAKITARPHPALAAAGMGEDVLVTQSDSVHFHTGSLTSMCAWPAYWAPEPVVTIGAKEGESLGVIAGDRVRIITAEGRCEARADVSKAQPTGVAAVSGGFVVSRSLFPWNSSRRTGPTTARIEKIPSP